MDKNAIGILIILGLLIAGSIIVMLLPEEEEEEEEEEETTEAPSESEVALGLTLDNVAIASIGSDLSVVPTAASQVFDPGICI